jgi:site-specific DNA-adenine methylase
MFYYYGRKKQLARYYPSPKFDTIVEPFAGSAAYSLYGSNWRRQVVLVEKDEKVASIWRWLIEDATAEEILRMPDLLVGEKSSEFLHIIHAVTKMAFAFRTIKVTPVLARNWEISKRHMAADLHKIKHWTIVCGDYTESPDVEATWFIDPPYKGGSGMGYRHNSALMDYEALADWAMSRKGQVIFCEGNEGDYLPFVRLREQKGVAGKSSSELVFVRGASEESQQRLFADAG